MVWIPEMMMPRCQLQVNVIMVVEFTGKGNNGA